MLNVGIPADPQSLDPVRYNDGSIAVVYTPVVEGLYKLSPKGALIPVLAAGPPVANSGFTRFEIPIRQGVKFHNGKPLTSADVKYTVEQIVNPKNASNNSSFYSLLKSVEAPNPHTVVFNMKSKNRYFVPEALIATKIVPSNVHYTPATWSQRLIGTGPFKFVEWVHGQKVVLERNDHYWQKGLPYLGGVEYQIIPTQAAQITSLVNGSIQMLPNLPPAYASVARSRGMTLYSPPNVHGLDWLWPNWLAKSPVGNVDMRLAIAYAINRERIAKQVYKGFATPESTIPASGSLGYSKAVGSSIPPAGDPAAAKHYLAAAGGAPSKPLVLVAPTSYEQSDTECQFLQEDLAKVGIQVVIEQQSLAVAGGNLIQGNYDLWFITEGVTMTPNQAALLDTPGSFLNYNHVNDPRLTALATEAMNNAAAVPQVQKRALQTMPQIPIVYYPPIYGLSKAVQSFVSTFANSDLTGLATTRLA